MKIADGINAARMLIPKCHFDKDKCGEGVGYLKQYRQEFDERRKFLETIRCMILRHMRQMRFGISLWVSKIEVTLRNLRSK